MLEKRFLLVGSWLEYAVSWLRVWFDHIEKHVERVVIGRAGGLDLPVPEGVLLILKCDNISHMDLKRKSQRAQLVVQCWLLCEEVHVVFSPAPMDAQNSRCYCCLYLVYSPFLRITHTESPYATD